MLRKLKGILMPAKKANPMPFDDPEVYGVFHDCDITIDNEKRIAIVTVYYEHDVEEEMRFPIPVLAAYACDNVHGKALQQTSKLKP